MSTNETLSKSTKNKQYLIVFVAMLMQAIPFGIAQNIQPLFIGPVVNDLFPGNLAGFNIIFTVGAVGSAICAPFLGKLFGKVNIKAIFIFGAILSGFGFLMFGYSKSLVEFYGWSVVSQIGTVTFSGLGIPYVISKWFPGKGRGKALGIAFSGGSIGNVFLQPIVANLIESQGYAPTYVMFGIVSMVCSIPLILILINLPKEEIVDENTNTDKDMPFTESESAHEEGLGMKAASKNPFFWTFSVGYMIIAISIAALSTQYGIYLGEIGMDSKTIGLVGSLFAASCLIGNVMGGGLFDKIGSLKTMGISWILITLGIVAMILAKGNPTIAFGFSVFYGLNVYSYMSAPAFMAQDIFGKKETSQILGLISVTFALGFAFGSALFGMIVDNFGFDLAWMVLLGSTAVGYAILLFSIKTVKSGKGVKAEEVKTSVEA